MAKRETMARFTAWITLTALALAGCATTEHVDGPQTATHPRPQIESLTYATTPCHGFCPVYRVTISDDGAGVFTGTSNTAVTGERRFRATPAQVADFFKRLQPYLPVGELLLADTDACKMYATDLPSADVKWTGRSGAGHLLYNYGCDRDAHHTLADALRGAPQAVG
jgi:hypothetical protein